MIKRILAGAAATGLALSLMNAGGATAATCTAPTSTHPATATAPLPDGGAVYLAPSGTGGYAGVAGPHGFIEATGTTNGGHISGNSNDAPVYGYIGGTTGGAPTVCIAGQGT